LEGGAEVFADVAVVDAAPDRVTKDEDGWCLVAWGEPAFAELADEGGGEVNIAAAGGGLEGCELAVAVELAVDVDERLVVVDVGPGEAEGFADAEAGVGKELQQRPAALSVGEEAGELLTFGHRARSRGPWRVVAVEAPVAAWARRAAVVNSIEYSTRP
jgi:hypothetical protein